MNVYRFSYFNTGIAAPEGSGTWEIAEGQTFGIERE